MTLTYHFLYLYFLHYVSPDTKVVPEQSAGPCQLATFKAPAYMEVAATGWFHIMDAQFHLHNITTEETRFYNTLAALPAETVARVPHDVLDSGKYSELKDSVLALYESTKTELFDQLISKTVMTDRPSIFLEEIKRIASKVGVTDDLIRHKFIQSLPTAIAPVIATQQDMSLSQVGKLVDELFPLLGSKCLLSQSVSSSAPAPTPRPSHSRVNNKYRVRPFYADQRPKVCRGHLYFGVNSRWCKPWCQWPTKDGCHIQSSSWASALPSCSSSSSRQASGN